MRNLITTTLSIAVLAFLTGAGCARSEDGATVPDSELDIRLGIEESRGLEGVLVTVDEVVARHRNGRSSSLLSRPMVIALDASEFSEPSWVLTWKEGQHHAIDSVSIRLNGNMDITISGDTESRAYDSISELTKLSAVSPGQTSWLAFRLGMPSQTIDGFGLKHPTLELTSMAHTTSVQYSTFEHVYGAQVPYMFELADVVGEFEVVDTRAEDLEYRPGQKMRGVVAEVEMRTPIKGGDVGTVFNVRTLGGGGLFVSNQPTFVAGESFYAALERLDSGYYRIVGGEEGKIGQQ